MSKWISVEENSLPFDNRLVWLAVENERGERRDVLSVCKDDRYYETDGMEVDDHITHWQYADIKAPALPPKENE